MNIAPNTALNTARQNMIDGQLKPFNVINETVLQAFARVPREAFLKPEQHGQAYREGHMPMGQGRFMPDVALFARLLQDGQIKPTDHVLDIGCLTGYSTAVLACLAAKVTGHDNADFIAQAQKNMTAQNVSFSQGALTAVPKGPFDAIVMAGTIETLPLSLGASLVADGRVLCFWRDESQKGFAACYHWHKNFWRQEILFDAFVPAMPGFERVENFAL